MTFYNTATLTYAGNTIRSNTVSGTITEAIDGDKIPLSRTYRAGDEVSYLITLRNTADVAMTNVSMTDNLGEGTYGTETHIPMAVKPDTVNVLVNGTPVTDADITIAPILTVGGFDIPAGGSATVAYTAILNDYAPLTAGEEINNTVEVTADNLAAPISFGATITPVVGAVLAVEKNLMPTVIPEDGNLLYTFTIRNFGNAATTAADAVVLKDTFNPRITINDVYYNRTRWQEGTNYTYEDGEFTTLANQITVPAATITRGTDDTVQIEPGTVTIIIYGTV